MMKIFFALGVTASLLANPNDASVMAGTATLNEPHPGMLEITTSEVAIINWADFSIRSGETTRFIQPNQMSAVLNRVTGGNPSDLQGQLLANGTVYLINSNGVFISPDAIVQTNNFLSTTFEIADADFLAHDFASGTLYVPPAVQPHDHPFATAIRHEGQFSATTLEERGGRFYLIADRVDVSGAVEAPNGDVRIVADRILVSESARIDVSGSMPGRIEIGGGPHGKDEAIPNAGQVAVLKGAELLANSTSHEDGGTIVVWSENGTWFHGSAEARGALAGGNGGWIEVSGKKFLDYQGLAATTAPKGTVGTLLLDPITITVTAGDSNISGPPIFMPTAAPSTIAAMTITSNLMSSAVIVESSGAAGAENGDVIISVPIMYTESNDLTFRTNNLSTAPAVPNGNIQIDADVINMGTGSIFFDASGDIIQTSATVSTAGSLSYTALGALELTSGASDSIISATGAGSISITTGDDFTLTAIAPTDARVSVVFPATGTAALNIGGDLSLIPSAPGGSVSIGAQTALTISVENDLSMDAANTAAGCSITLFTGPLNIDVGGNALLNGSSFIDGANQLGTSNMTIAGNLTMLDSANMAQNLSGGFSLNVGGDMTMIGDPIITVGHTLTSPGGSLSIVVGGSFYGQGDGDIDVIGNTTELSLRAGGNIQLVDEFFFGSFGDDRPVTIQAGHDVIFDGLATGEAGFSMNNDGPITVLAGNDFIMQNAALYDNSGDGPLSITAGHSISITGDAEFIFGGATDFTLICDNNFPTAPGIGSGQFIKTAAPDIDTLGGLLLIYTAIREQNTVQGLLNGTPFVPGPLFVNSNTEMWGIYAPHNSGVPFTIFYKNIQVPINAVTDFNIAYFDFLQNVSQYFDRLFFNMKDFNANGVARMVQPLYWPNNPVWFAPDLYLP